MRVHSTDFKIPQVWGSASASAAKPTWRREWWGADRVQPGSSRLGSDSQHPNARCRCCSKGLLGTAGTGVHISTEMYLLPDLTWCESETMTTTPHPGTVASQPTNGLACLQVFGPSPESCMLCRQGAHSRNQPEEVSTQHELLLRGR
jgi:hypothetical protein